MTSERDVRPRPHVVRRGTGVPLVMVHGNGVDHRLLLELDEVFAAPGRWERIHVDLPGFGRSPALPRGSAAALDRAGHNVHLDRPGVVAALLAD